MVMVMAIKKSAKTIWALTLACNIPSHTHTHTRTPFILLTFCPMLLSSTFPPFHSPSPPGCPCFNCTFCVEREIDRESSVSFSFFLSSFFLFLPLLLLSPETHISLAVACSSYRSSFQLATCQLAIFSSLCQGSENGQLS